MQCRQLSVWSVYFNFNALSSPNYFFLREGDVHNTYGNSSGMGAFFVFQNWKFVEEGAYVN